MLKTVGNPSTRYGDQTIVDGNLVIGTAGKGIDFSATSSGTGTMTSELLDDYEEGTFTPVVAGSTTAGTGTYTKQYGRYTKVGNKVTFLAVVIWSAHDGTGNILVQGLPFTSATNSASTDLTPVSLLAADLTFSNQLVAFIARASTEVSIASISSGAARAAVAMDAAAALYISGTYFVN